jgi:hypothetical protein
VIQVIFKNHPGDLIQSGARCGHLIQDFWAIAIFFQHLPDTADLAFQTGHALQDGPSIVC